MFFYLGLGEKGQVISPSVWERRDKQQNLLFSIFCF